MNHRTLSSLLYLLAACFIGGWWTLAFYNPSPSSSLSPSFSFPSPTLTLNTANLLNELSPFDRHDLKRALTGDFAIMRTLIDEWDQDAILLSQKGLNNIQRLSSETFLQAHVLDRLLQDSSPETLLTLNRKFSLKELPDDQGNLLTLSTRTQRFLPQSYVAASFLLAIATPQEIIAIPSGLRILSQLYDPTLVAQIPSNVEHTSAETLYLAHPDLAFVAPYSHPATLNMFHQLQIPCFTLGTVHSLSDIQSALLKVGHATHHILEAQLLAIFMEASLLAIDNRLHALASMSSQELNLLYLDYRQVFRLPTTKCLAGQLLTRALQHHTGLNCPIPSNEQEWFIPIDHEKMQQFKPDCVIIATPCPATCLDLKELCFKQIALVDEAIQESPTQYHVLAYFDIYQSLASTYHL